ncbi:MAG TPA: hypothetical protein VGQ06_10375 [Gemmatimonadales bacterium]|jgi:hypothetical protein|nr:hypothetical protein [Gemmatimonadales bacterium]
MRSALALSSLIGLAVLPVAAHAQTGYSLELGAVTAYEASLFQVGFRAAPSRGGRAAPDVALATFPDALVEGVFIGMLDLDLTYGAPLGEDAVLLPRFGVSVIAGAGGGGAGGAFGYNLGLGALARMSPTLGLRMDYTHRRFGDEGESLPLSSISIGIVWMH